MRKLVWLVATFTLMLVVSPVSGQSLGEVAKKERERRARNKSEGASVREFTEEEIFGPDDDAESSGELGEAEVEPGAADVSSRSNADAVEDWEAESRERRRNETEWRARVGSARARVERARERRDELDGLNLSVGEQYVDANGNPVIHDLEHLQRLVREADQELAAAERALEELVEEARREGVPPGWLRPGP